MVTGGRRGRVGEFFGGQALPGAAEGFELRLGDGELFAKFEAVSFFLGNQAEEVVRGGGGVVGGGEAGCAT